VETVSSERTVAKAGVIAVRAWWRMECRLYPAKELSRRLVW